MGSCVFGSVECFSSDDLRVLGMRFAKDSGMCNHVRYWLDRGLMVRGRIGALAQRFGSEGGIRAWEIMRLMQGAYLPVVEYGFEFVACDHTAIKRIDVHIRDCLHSLFRMEVCLANNMLHL